MWKSIYACPKKHLLQLRTPSGFQLQHWLPKSKGIVAEHWQAASLASVVLQFYVVTIYRTSNLSLNEHTMHGQVLNSCARINRQYVIEQYSIPLMIPKIVSCTYCNGGSKRQRLYNTNAQNISTNQVSLPTQNYIILRQLSDVCDSSHLLQTIYCRSI